MSPPESARLPANDRSPRPPIPRPLPRRQFKRPRRPSSSNPRRPHRPPGARMPVLPKRGRRCSTSGSPRPASTAERDDRAVARRANDGSSCAARVKMAMAQPMPAAPAQLPAASAPAAPRSPIRQVRCRLPPTAPPRRQPRRAILTGPIQTPTHRRPWGPPAATPRRIRHRTNLHRRAATVRVE